MRNLKFVLIEKNPIMLQRLSKVISKVDEFFLLGSFPSLQVAENVISVVPDIVLLNVEDDADEVFILRKCRNLFKQSDIICLSSSWNEKIASGLFRNGGSGYLIKPFNENELIRTVLSLEEKVSKTLCTVSTFYSPKGKSGRTTLIANLATELANNWDQEVLVIDADLQFGDMAVFFNLEPNSTIVEAVRDVKFLTPTILEEYLTTVNEHIKVLCGTRSPEFAESVNPQDLAKVIAIARRTYQHILVDLPPGFNPTAIATMEDANNVFVVSMMNGTYEVENAQRSMEIFKAWSNFNTKVHSIFTRVWPYTEKERLNLESKLGYPVSLIVPNEYVLVSSSVNSGVMAVEESPNSQFADSITVLANRLCHNLGVR